MAEKLMDEVFQHPARGARYDFFTASERVTQGI